MSAVGGIAQANIGPIGVGGSVTFTLTLQLTGWGMLSWTADVTGDQNDLQPANNRATATVAVAEAPGVLEFASPSIVVDEAAGYAIVTVARSVGAGGWVTVHYQTAGGSATAGLDYIPASGTLTFGPGVTSQSFAVRVLGNPHDNHDEVVGLFLDSPTSGALLGSVTSAALRIRDIDPDMSPPQVANLQWYGSAAAITSIALSFSEPLLDTSAGGGAAYQIVDLGTSGQARPASVRTIGLSPPSYNPTTQTVTLIPAAPLASGHFYRIVVSGSGTSAVRDLAGNPLAGAGPGQAGTDYVALFGRGTSLKYYDSAGNLVTLKVKGGGYLDEIRNASGEGLILRLQGGIPHRSVLSGTVARPKRARGGATTLQTVEGLGPFGAIRVTLTSPPFIVRQYPFLAKNGRLLTAKSGPARVGR